MALHTCVAVKIPFGYEIDYFQQNPQLFWQYRRMNPSKGPPLQ